MKEASYGNLFEQIEGFLPAEQQEQRCNNLNFVMIYLFVVVKYDAIQIPSLL